MGGGGGGGTVVGERALSQVPISEVRRVAFELTVVDLEDSGELFIGAVQVSLATPLLVNSSTFVHFRPSLTGRSGGDGSLLRQRAIAFRAAQAGARARAERPPYSSLYHSPYCTKGGRAARGAAGVREGRAAQGRAAHQRGSPSVLTGHVSSFPPYQLDTSRSFPRTNWTLLVLPPVGLRQEAARARRRLPPGEPRQQPQPQLRGQFLRRRASPPLPYKVDTSRPSLHTNWTRLVALTRSRRAQLPAELEGNSVMARLQDYALKQNK